MKLNRSTLAATSSAPGKSKARDAPNKARRYMERRYRTPDQRLVNALESRVIKRYVDAITRPGDSLLDLACGYGRFSEYGIRRGLRVTVADKNSAMLELVTSRLGPVPSYCCRSHELPFEDGAFDAAICIRLIQHLRTADERRATLRELARVTRGDVVVSVYDNSVLHGLIHRSRKLKRLHRYSAESLQEELAGCGLRIIHQARPLHALHAQRVLLLGKT